MVQFPCPNRSVCLHRRGRPPRRPGGTSKTQHMLWANSQPPRCGSVKGFHACTNVALRIPDSRRAAKRERPSAPVCRRAMLGATPLSGSGGSGCRGRQPLRRRRSAALVSAVMRGSAPVPGARSSPSFRMTARRPRLFSIRRHAGRPYALSACLPHRRGGLWPPPFCPVLSGDRRSPLRPQNAKLKQKRMRKQAFTSFFDSLDRLLHGPLEEVLQGALGVGKGKRRAAPGREAH